MLIVVTTTITMSSDGRQDIYTRTHYNPKRRIPDNEVTD